MVNAQKYINKNYPKEEREKITELNINDISSQEWDGNGWKGKDNWDKLEGELDLSDFTNLEELDCSTNEITSLNVNNCHNLKKFYCDDNQLTSLNLTNLANLEELNCNLNQLTELEIKNCPQLKNFYCRNNYLTNLDFLNNLNPEKLNELDISNNNFSEQVLSVFNKFVNLEGLHVGNDDQERINQGIYNRFTGSLEPLQNLSKLVIFDISNTQVKDLEDGEYIKNWGDINQYFTPELVKEWEDKGFNYETCKSYIDFGCQPQEAELTDYLWECQENKLDNDIETARIEYPKWKDLGFTLKDIMSWKGQGFTPKWLDIGLTPSDYFYYCWLKNSKQLTPEQVLGNEQQLREEYNKASIASQQWLDLNYPQEKRSKVTEIYLTEPSLAGELDLSDFTYELTYEFKSENIYSGVKILISHTVDASRLVINKRRNVEIIKLVQAQNYIDREYPTKESRTEITKLNVRSKLEGELDLSDFANLEELDCRYNKLTNLNLSNCSCLTKLCCFSNLLTNLTLPTSPTNLSWLDLRNNNLPPQDLSFLTPYVNLKRLDLGNPDFYADEEGIRINQFIQNIYNRFTGSLDYLSGMKNLKEIDISNTDINKVNIEQLPRSLEEINYSTDKRPDCKLTEIVLRLDKCKWGFCQKCKRFKTNHEWCQSCAEEEWQEDIKNLASQELFEKFLERQPPTNYENKLRWIPYEEFTNVSDKPIGEGGFSKVYKAKWITVEHKQYSRNVVLKTLDNSQNITFGFFNEIINTRLVNDFFNVVICWGISQDPVTKDCIMVMDYKNGGNLRDYLKKHYRELNWEDKLYKLYGIASGLKNIHDKKLVHRDLHSGNILNYGNKGDKNVSTITDLGLSRPASEKVQQKIFGVLPYVAPEVLCGGSYTPVADIYSFGMIAYEILTGLSPYHDISHDPNLASKICQGLRPQFQIKIPQLLEDLIKKCWDADPNKRPSAKELDGIYKIFYLQGDNEFSQQLQAAEVYNESLPKEIRFPSYTNHPLAICTSRLLEFPNFLRPQNNPSQEWQTTTLLDLQIKAAKEGIDLLKQPLENELSNLAENFIQSRKKMIKNKKDKEAKNNAKELHKKLIEKGLAKEKIEEIIRYCEKLVEFEQQLEQEKLQVKIEIPTNK